MAEASFPFVSDNHEQSLDEPNHKYMHSIYIELKKSRDFEGNGNIPGKERGTRISSKQNNTGCLEKYYPREAVSPYMHF